MLRGRSSGSESSINRSPKRPCLDREIEGEELEESVMDPENTENVSLVEVMNLLKDLKRNQDDMKKSLEDRLKSISKDISTKIDTLREDMYLELANLDKKVLKIEERMETLEKQSEARLREIEARQPVEEYPVETSVILINFRENASEDIDAKCTQLIQEDLGLRDIKPVRSIRLQSRNDKPGIVKVQLKTKADKINVLRNKEQLKSSRHHKRVFIRSAQSHEERLMRINMQTLLDELPGGGSQYRFTGSGRLVKKDQDNAKWPGSQQNRTTTSHGSTHNEGGDSPMVRDSTP